MDGISNVKWVLNTAPTYAVSYNGCEFEITQSKNTAQHLSFSWVSTGFFDSAAKRRPRTDLGLT